MKKKKFSEIRVTTYIHFVGGVCVDINVGALKSFSSHRTNLHSTSIT